MKTQNRIKKIMRVFNLPYIMAAIMVMASVNCYGIRWPQPDKTLSPYFFINSDNPEVDQLPLKHTSADVNIAGVIADVKVNQVYVNEGKNPIEAIYIFPASTRAAVYGMKMIIGERVLTADIQEKQKARQQYEEAKEQGKTASLLEQQRPNVFQMNVANILPGDSIIVSLRYTELLAPEEGIYEFVYPTVVGPRYSNQPVATASSSDLWVENPYLRSGEDAPYSFNINTVLNAGMPIKQITCTFHEVNVNYDGKSSARIILKEENGTGSNRDYILKYQLAGSKIESGVLLYEGKDENFFLAMLQPPKRISAEQIPGREYIFIVDISGSMYGFPLDISKKLLKDLIGNLRPTDKFNVMLFAGGNSVMSENSLPATQDNINKAINLIENQRGGGGTELLPALKRALALPKAEGFSRSVVIATDGYVHVEKEAFDLIRNNLGESNFFSFGIGSSVNRFIIEGMARVGNGEPFVITKQSEASAQADKFRKYIQTPVLTDIKADYGDFTVYDIEPYSISDVLAERPVLVYGKYKGNPKGRIKFTGVTGNETFTASLDLASAIRSEENAALKYLWARQRIAILDDYNQLGNSNEFEKEVTDLGLKYNLLTAYTSFVAIDSIVRNDGTKAVTVKQPLPLPQGVSDYAVGGNGSIRTMSGALGQSYSNRMFKSYEPDMDMEETISAPAMQDEKEAELYISADVMPEFPGGQSKLIEFLTKELKYPEEEAKLGIGGTVYLSFVVDETGNIRDIKVVRGVSAGLDAEAIRVLKQMPKWIPGEKDGKKVKVQMTLPVKFKLS